MKIITYLIELLRGLNELIQIKNLEQKVHLWPEVTITGIALQYKQLQNWTKYMPRLFWGIGKQVVHDCNL